MFKILDKNEKAQIFKDIEKYNQILKQREMSQSKNENSEKADFEPEMEKPGMKRTQSADQ